MKLKPILSLDIPMHSQGKGRARSSGKSGTHYTPKDTRTKEAYMMMCVAKEMEGKPIVKGAIELTVGFLISLRKSLTKAEKELYKNNLFLPTVKPDIDNTLKSVMDAMNGIVWLDDKQVVRVVMDKVYTEVRPLIHIEVKEMVGDDDA